MLTVETRVSAEWFKSQLLMQMGCIHLTANIICNAALYFSSGEEMTQPSKDNILDVSYHFLTNCNGHFHAGYYNLW